MKTAARQRGFTFGGFIMVLVIFIVLAIMSMKLIPAYMENGKIQKALDAIVHDPDMRDAKADEIRNAFSKRANTMDAVTVIGPEDIEIEKVNGSLVLSATYNVKVRIGGNASLFLEFHPTTAK